MNDDFSKYIRRCRKLKQPKIQVQLKGAGHTSIQILNVMNVYFEPLELYYIGQVFSTADWIEKEAVPFSVVRQTDGVLIQTSCVDLGSAILTHPLHLTRRQLETSLPFRDTIYQPMQKVALNNRLIHDGILKERAGELFFVQNSRLLNFISNFYKILRPSAKGSTKIPLFGCEN